MFTPENFYCVIKENFATTPFDTMFIPTFNGAKCFLDFVEYDNQPISLNRQLFTNRLNLRPIWMYDQEPLFFDIDNNFFKHKILDISQSCFHDKILSSHDSIWAAYYTRSTSFPIWCTSEKNSPEIKKMEETFFIPCYYWYHAFIARDWYRHWQYNRSLLPFDKSQTKYKFLFYCRDTTGTRIYRKKIIEYLTDFNSQILHNDHSNMSSNLSAHIDIHDAQQSGIHIVAETLFDTDKLYLTEKVFKPMVMSQPFIIFGPPKTLQYLKDYGFKTFSDIWDESYDCVTDHDKRLSMVCELIKSISTMPADQYQKMYARCLAAIEHNRRWFYDQKFMDICWTELSNSFAYAQDKRNALEEKYPGGHLCHVFGNNPDLLEINVFKNFMTNVLTNFDLERRIKVLSQYPIFNDL